MNSLDDLRTSLRSHARDAERATPLDLATRSEQVRGRVRAVRRRRAAGALVAAVAVVAAVVGPTLLPDDRSADPAGAPVPAELAGHTVPPTIEAAGWTYQYAGSVTGDDVVEIDLEASAEPRVLAWANESSPVPDHLDAWKVVVPGGPTYAPTAADFSEFWQVPADVEGTFRFHGPAESALAVYELSDERPPGVTVEGVTFRERVAGDRLVVADVVRGEAALPLRLTVPEGTLRFGAFCAGADAGVELALVLDGDVVTSGTRCDGRPSFDPGSSSFATFTGGLATAAGPVRPGDVLDVEVRLRDADGRLVDAGDDVLLGASFYELADPAATELANQPVPEVVEVGGATWALTATESHVATAGTTRSGPVREPSMAWVFVTGLPRDAVAKVSVGREEGSGLQGAEGSLGGILVPAGGRVDVRVERAGPDPRHTWGVAFYTRAD